MWIFNTSLRYPHRTINDPLFSGFIQDQWALPGSRFSLIVGSKFEHNNSTGVEVQPGARLLWTPEDHHAAWMAVSRAVRTPSYVDYGLRASIAVIPGSTPSVEVIRRSFVWFGKHAGL